jgi:hypothetical protein
MRKRVWELSSESVRKQPELITEQNEMTPDELIEVLKRYHRESNQSERALASQIGVNHHTLSRWLRDMQCPNKGPLALAASFLRRVGYL